MTNKLRAAGQIAQILSALLNNANSSVVTMQEELGEIHLQSEKFADTQETSASMTELDRMVNNCSQATQEPVSLSENVNTNMSKFKL